MREGTYPTPLAAVPRALWGYALMAVLLALLRFGNTTPDSAHYVALVEYFRGNLPREGLQSPFAYRWVVPWVASWPTAASPRLAIALGSLISIVAAYIAFGRLLARLVADARQWHLGMGFLVFSFPTLNYSAAVLTDSAGFLVLVLAAWALVAHRFLALGAVLAIGVGVRESTLVMLPAIWIFLLLERDRRGLIAALGVTAAALMAVAAARWWFSDLPAYFWTPSWKRCLANLTRPISWATVLLTMAPVGIGALAGLRHWGRLPAVTRRLVLAVSIPGGALVAYSVTSAYMSGRFCWPLYLALVPLASWAVRGREAGAVPPARCG